MKSSQMSKRGEIIVCCLTKLGHGNCFSYQKISGYLGEIGTWDIKLLFPEFWIFEFRNLQIKKSIKPREFPFLDFMHLYEAAIS